MPSFGPISGAPVGAESPSGSPSAAVATPAGVYATALVGAATATGGTSSTAQPAGVSAFARVGQAIVVGSSSSNPMIGLDTTIDAGPVGLNTLISFGPTGLNTFIG